MQQKPKATKRTGDYASATISWDDLDAGRVASVGLGGIGMPSLQERAPREKPLPAAPPAKAIQRIKKGLRAQAEAPPAPTTATAAAPVVAAFGTPTAQRTANLIEALEAQWASLVRTHRPEVVVPRWDQYMRRDVEELIDLYGEDACALSAAMEYLVVCWDRVCARFTRGGVSVVPSISLLRRFHADIVNEGQAWREIRDAEAAYREAVKQAAPQTSSQRPSAVILPVAPEANTVSPEIRDRYLRAQALRRKYSAVRFD